MKRKTIALVVTGYDWEYETKIIDGVYECCQKAGYNLLVFATMVRQPSINQDRILESNVLHGETEIFQLMNYDLIDGVLILGDNLVNPDCIFEIEEKAMRHGVPVINVNDKLRVISQNILVENRDAMEMVVRHLIDVHKVTKINFIGGYPGNIQTEERLAAYRKVLLEHGIPYEEKRVAYGEFWIKAKDCAEQFYKEGLPEAIVCASDTMAIFAMEQLKKHGILAPRDIIITGFDGISDCDTHNPTLTTVRPAYRRLGMEAVGLLEKLWAGEPVDKIVRIPSDLVLHRSCGCEKEDENYIHKFNEKYDIYNEFKAFNHLLIDMNSMFAEATNSEQLYQSIGEGANFFQFKRMFLCICDIMEFADRKVKNVKEGTVRYGLTDHCVSMYAKNNEVPVRYEFETKNMLPVDLLQGDEPVFMAFTSLYFKDSYIGYIAYEPKATHGYVGVLFQTWILQIGNHAGSFYLRNELQAVVEKLEHLYAKDPLTGLYNRRGLEKHSDIVQRAQKNGTYITVVVCDVDHLKIVNDAYGHEGGDNVILSVANALKEAMPKDAVCVRTGGDEFLAFFGHDSEMDVEQLLRKVELNLKEFNENSGLPYEAECSCGYYTQKMLPDISLDELCNVADVRMYAVKREKKAMRE